MFWLLNWGSVIITFHIPFLLRTAPPPPPFWSLWAVPRELQTPQSPLSILTHSKQCQSNTGWEGASSFLLDSSCLCSWPSLKIFCLVLVHVRPLSLTLDLLSSLLSAALVSVLTVYLFLVVLGTNLVISQVPGKETSLLWDCLLLLRGTRASVPARRDLLAQFHHLKDEETEFLRG